MRVAVQISGAPRFCRDFDLFLEKLKNYTDVDWFFYLWKENPFPEVNNRDLVADSWRSIPNVEWAANKIQENLPGGHTIRILELADQTVYANSEKIQRVIEAHADSMWKMFQGFYQVNQLRINYEQGHDPYDLVIRARNDAGIIGNFNLEEIYGRCSNNNNAVIISDNHRHGHRSLKLNDIFAVSLPKNITIYCDLVNNIVKYNQEGIPFHPETLLAHHLTTNNLKVEDIGFEVVLRSQGSVIKGKFTSDFGRWA